MKKAVKKKENEQIGKIMCCSCMGRQMILRFCHADQIPQFSLIRPM
jgi:hypothetical protein